jgi:folate-binding protein YgfZ
VDFDADRIATELSLPGAISLTKGCYVGQEVVARTSNRGQVRRQRVGFRFEWGGESLPSRTEILSAGSPAGFVTSAAREPGSADGLAMGFLSTDALSGSAPIHITQGGQIVPIRVAAWPL